MRFGLDVDGVLYKWSATGAFLLNEEFGLELGESTSWNYLQDNVTEKQWKWLWTTGIERGLFRYGSLFKGARRFVDRLYEEGHDIVIITSRPEEALEDTMDWFSYQKLPAMEYHIIGHEAKKSDIKCDVYLDDSPRVLKDIVENRRSALMLLMDRPWNQEEHIAKSLRQSDQWYRVLGWDDVFLALEEYG